MVSHSEPFWFSDVYFSRRHDGRSAGLFRAPSTTEIETGSSAFFFLFYIDR